MKEKIETIVEKDIYDLAVEAYTIMFNKVFNAGFIVAENLNRIEEYYGWDEDTKEYYGFRLDELFNTLFTEAYNACGLDKSVLIEGCAKTLITFCENIFDN